MGYLSIVSAIPAVDGGQDVPVWRGGEIIAEKLSNAKSVAVDSLF